MLVYADRVKETASNKPNGSTAFNLPDTGATGYRSFDSVLATNDTCVYCAENGSAWEVGLGTFTAGTPDTLTRTTLYASSTGSAIDFSSGGDVSVFITSDASQIRNAHLRSVAASPTTAGITGEIGVMHVLDVSGLTADRDFTLPAACAVGDRVGVMLSTGDATYELLLKPATGDTINGGSASAEWSRLFITGEVVVFRCVTADAAWVVEYDGRIPSSSRIYLSADASNTSTSTVTVPLNTNDTALDVGDLTDTANNGITVRRASRYSIFSHVSWASLADGKVGYQHVAIGGADQQTIALSRQGSAGSCYATGSIIYQLAAGSLLTIESTQNDSTSESWQGGADTSTCSLTVTEVL